MASPIGATAAERLWTADFIKLNVGNFMLFFAFYLLMPLLPIYLGEVFGTGKHTTGVVLAGYTVLALLARPVAGYIVDSYDRKRMLLLFYSLYFVFFSGYLIVGSLVAFAILRTLHGLPFGATTVANSTAAIDALLPSRRAEGIGYYGLSNNMAMATAPTVAIYIYELCGSFDVLFSLSILFAGVGLAFDASIHPRERQPMSDRHVSLDRFFLLKGWGEAVVMCLLSSSYGVVSTYIAIYSKEVLLGRTDSSGLYFMILSCGLMLSRLIGGRSLRKGRILENAQWGMTLSVLSYVFFAIGGNMFFYYASAVILGLGNGHMFPAMQSMFINLAPHSRRGAANATLLTAWDAGIGLGVIVGGVVSEHWGYVSAFWVAAALNVVGVGLFWSVVRGMYLRDRLR